MQVSGRLPFHGVTNPEVTFERNTEAVQSPMFLKPHTFNDCALRCPLQLSSYEGVHGPHVFEI